MVNFLRYRYASYLWSAFIVVAFIGMFFYKKNATGTGFSYSIDFTGGTQVRLKFAQPLTSQNLKGILENAGWHNPVLRELSTEQNTVIVRVKEVETDSKGLAERMKSVLQEAIPGNDIKILQSESVGAGIGATLRWKSARAVILALLLMLLYIAFRFWSFAFAAGAVLALFHDAIVMLACCLFFDREISSHVIAAILAVLGYSVNDTIVIFAQIRDNIKKMRGSSLTTIVNTSLNQTLTRTLLTSISTALTVVSMLFLGGEALRDFSLILLVGIIFGTYSSIYIASPIMMLLYKESKQS